MGDIFVTSDLHMGHNKDFVVEYRGFTTIDEHDEKLIENWNSIVTEDDEVYVLGDLVVGQIEKGLEHLAQLHGKIHIIRGNHDSTEKLKRYGELENVVEIADAKYLRYAALDFFLCHYPVLVSHDKIKKMKTAIINLYGHTHQKDNFYYIDKETKEPHPYMYHVGVDSHSLFPIRLDDVIEEIRHEKNNYDGRHQKDNQPENQMNSQTDSQPENQMNSHTDS